MRSGDSGNLCAGEMILPAISNMATLIRIEITLQMEVGYPKRMQISTGLEFYKPRHIGEGLY